MCFEKKKEESLEFWRALSQETVLSLASSGNIYRGVDVGSFLTV